MMQVLNFGSINTDLVLTVDHIVRPAETQSCLGRRMLAGGKGANQSVALARAGIRVAHAGRVGADGEWLLKRMGDFGVETRFILVGKEPTGQAIIQVDRAGQNSILLLAGANHAIEPRDVEAALGACAAGTTLLLQNEISEVPRLISEGRRRGLRVVFNPAPFTREIAEYPLEAVDMLVLNETEGSALAGVEEAEEIVARLARRFPEMEIVLTLGPRGVLYGHGIVRIEVAAPYVEAVDTTAAGDCFIGYFLAGRLRGLSAKESLAIGCRAAAVSVTRPGAMDSIPLWREVVGNSEFRMLNSEF